MYQNEEIPGEEYYFTIMISDKYSKNLKIKMPIFELLIYSTCFINMIKINTIN